MYSGWARPFLGLVAIVAFAGACDSATRSGGHAACDAGQCAGSAGAPALDGGGGAGGGTHPASGGSSPGGASGNAGSATGGATVDCANVGCGPPVVCGEACSSACGCCFCGAGDYTLVQGRAFECAGRCYAPATYSVVMPATNVLRYSLAKVSAMRGTCHRIDLANYGGQSAFGISAPQGWFVEHVWESANPSDCDSVLPGPAPGAIEATFATGSVTFDMPCGFSMNAKLTFSTDGAVPQEETFIAAGLAVSSVCPR